VHGYQEAGTLNIVFEQDEVILSEVEGDTVPELLSSLGLSRSDLPEPYPVGMASPGANRFLVPVTSWEALTRLRPNVSALRSLCERHHAIGCFVFTLKGAGNRREAWGRMFAPAIGVAEDLINGNSSGCLGAYLLSSTAAEGDVALMLTVFQGHAFGIPGKVVVKAQKNSGTIKTFIGGTATITGRAEMDIR
jgi:PhzF family phenazine biosynthesis protein